MGTARRFRASRGHRYPITVRPTNVDIAVAREIAGDTAPAPEQIARADLGRRRKGTSRSRGGRLASLSRPREGHSPRWQPRRAGRGCGRATAARDEAPVQSDPSGPQDRDWATFTVSLFQEGARTRFGQAMRCTWERWPRPPARCALDPVGRSERSRLGSR